MSRINKANLKKTIYYLKRNGFRETCRAVRERLEEKKQPPYRWTPPSETELEVQRSRWKERNFTVTFSILVPAYRTKSEYLRELVDSLRSQTYPKWELILADATEDDSVEKIITDNLGSEEGSAKGSGVFYTGVSGDAETANCWPRIRYIHLKQNAGIAGNTNQAIPFISGDYVGLLDHDDVLTSDALFETAAVIEEGKEQGRIPRMLYSDEDKCNGDRTEYYEPNFKEDFNLDLLLSNNYICHFLVMEAELIRKLRFRSEFEGAQDYDLVLRAAAEIGRFGREKEAYFYPEREIAHIPRVLYHWRCHTGSTAENPQSKLYAYEAGRRAIQDFVNRAGWRAKAEDTAHVGFYRLRYEGSPFDCRPDLGAIGGKVTGGTGTAEKKRVARMSAEGPREAGDGAEYDGKDMRPWRGRGARRGRKGRRHIVGGRMTEEGRVLYENLPLSYSGYLHRAVLSQDGEAVDIRNIRIRPECRELFRKVTGVSYGTVPGGELFDVSLLPGDCDYIVLSLKLCRALREAGYRILYLPE